MYEEFKMSTPKIEMDQKIEIDQELIAALNAIRLMESQAAIDSQNGDLAIARALQAKYDLEVGQPQKSGAEAKTTPASEVHYHLHLHNHAQNPGRLPGYERHRRSHPHGPHFHDRGHPVHGAGAFFGVEHPNGGGEPHTSGHPSRNSGHPCGHSWKKHHGKKHCHKRSG